MSRANNKRKKHDNSKEMNLASGKLEVVRSGMGFVTIEGREKDILIKRENMLTALDGDEVRVAVIKEGKHNGRTEGVIREVISRKQSEFSGQIEVKAHFAFVIPDKSNMPVDIFVPLQLIHEAKNGDHVMVRIVEWTGKTKNPVGEVVSVLTHESRNEVAMQGILVENGFPLHFPDEVQEEAARYTDVLDKAEIKKRKDIRKLLTMTIDPVDAKDFDDALSVKKLKNGWYEVGVHIADVSHYVTEGSALDKEAYHRATSVYLPDRVLPMLPEHLSNQLCSLRPDEDKFSFSAIFQINNEGEVRDYWLGKTVMRSKRRFTYEEVQEIIEGAEGDHKEILLLLNGIAQNLRKARFKKGAINFSSQEVRFQLDETGRPVGVVVKESKEAHQLIEEFMLLANKTVAAHVSAIKFKDKPVPFPYRVHDFPNEEKLGVFAAFASRFGYKFNLNAPDQIATSFNQMLKEVQGTPQQHVLESLGIRTMAKAIYTTENIGHYGLGFEDYCHFTSPIRRYPDVLVHRILQQVLTETISPVKNLEQQCRHCSSQERSAMEAERAANKYKQVEYMQQFVGDDLEAVISGVSGFGFWAETIAQKCEGMVSMVDLSHLDDFELIEGDYSLLGRNSGVRFRMGDKITVRVVSANLDKRQIDFTILELPGKPTAAAPVKKAPAKPRKKPEQPKVKTTKKK